MTDGEFERLVGEATSSLPREFLEKLENVAVVIQDEPSLEQRKELHLRPWTKLLGLYEGVSLQGRASTYAPLLPDKITIFKLSILSLSEDPEEIKKHVHDVVLHEIAHHFGFTDQQLRDIKKY